MNAAPVESGDLTRHASSPAPTIKLSEDQEAAQTACLDSLRRGEPTVLTGPAGSGKSTLMRSLVHHVIASDRRPVALCAPTGKAARRLQSTSGFRASTIHRLIYGGAAEDEDGELVFVEKETELCRRHVVVVDEASMLGTKLHAEMVRHLPTGVGMLFVGDAEQLEPVNDTWGVPMLAPTAQLTQVHRQAMDNPIIAAATAIRQGRGDEWMAGWAGEDERVALTRGGEDAALAWYLPRRDEDTTLITFTHRVRRTMNRRIRAALGLTGPLAVGDRILIRVNNPDLGILNGDVLRVTEVLPINNPPGCLRIKVAGRTDPLVINAALIEADPGEFWKWKRQELPPWFQSLPLAHVWYGDCLTVHSSQGSEWADVGFVWCQAYSSMRSGDPVAARRFLYTAITRASQRVSIFAGAR